MYFLTPILIEDVEFFISNIDYISKQWCIHVSSNNPPVFYVCLQTGQHEKIIIDACKQKLESKDNVILSVTEVLGVSAARNVCLDAIRPLDDDVCMFLDARIILTDSFFKAITSFKNSEQLAMKGEIVFCQTSVVSEIISSRGDTLNSLIVNNESNSTTLPMKKLNLIKECTLSKWVFKKNILDDLRFNENFGPGRDTSVKSAEDVVFLFDFLSKYDFNIVFLSSKYQVFRENRPIDLSKHLLYAEGHGAILRFLLFKSFRNYFFYFVLFFCNSFRFILKGKSGLQVTKKRLLGLTKNIEVFLCKK
ncbi:TPA: hypothetical protein ACOJPC_002306 [Vibrio fluvialis]|nr:hypothetical protein [Vibrio fluvialis]